MASAIVATIVWAELEVLQAIGLLLGLTGLIALVYAPLQWLPSAALVAFALVPGALVPTAYVSRAVTPGALVLIIWLFRVLLSKRRVVAPHPAVLGCLLGLIVWSGASSYSSALPQVSLAWTVSIVVGVFLPVLLGTRVEANLLARTWITLGAILSLYAIIEAVIGQNIIFAFFAENDVQHWSVYRAYAGFGHPLLAGTFFVSTFGLALGMWLTGDRRRWLLATSILSLAAAFATISRGAIVTAIVVVAILLVFVTFQKGATFSRVLIVVGIVVVGAFAAVQTPRLVERLLSVEVSRSNDARRSGLDVALTGADFYHWLGAGPAMSQRAVAQFNATQVRIESAYLQLLLSVGLPGLFLFVLALIGAGTIALRSGRLGPLAAMVGVTVSIGFYNSIDARWGSHILIGLSLLLCLKNVSRNESIDDTRAVPGADITNEHDSLNYVHGAAK